MGVEGSQSFTVITALMAPVGLDGLLGFIVWGAFVVPGMSVSVRRLHDIGRTGWWMAPWWGFQLLSLIVVVGFLLTWMGAFQIGADGAPEWFEALIAGNALPETVIALGGIMLVLGLAMLVYFVICIVFWCLSSQPRENRYGPPPYANVDVAVF